MWGTSEPLARNQRATPSYFQTCWDTGFKMGLVVGYRNTGGVAKVEN